MFVTMLKGKYQRGQFLLDNFLAQGQVGMKLSKSCSYGKPEENIFLRKGGGGVNDKLYMLGKRFHCWVLFFQLLHAQQNKT